MPETAGAVVLFGSGETAGAGRDALRWLADTGRTPRCVAVLETPAGFEGNSSAVARRWTDFFGKQSASSGMQVEQLPLRRRDGVEGTEDEAACKPLLGAELIALGAGSPTYTVRQLERSLAWRYATAAHRLGASLFLASAAANAAGALSMPVYEIYKVGEDPHWKPGLGVLDAFGLSLVIVPHWNNTDGGDALDTSRCFMGVERFARLLTALPAGMTTIGIEEHTVFAIDLRAETAHVLGHGAVSVVRDGAGARHPAGAVLPLAALGAFAPAHGPAASPQLAEAIAIAREGGHDPVPEDIAAAAAAREAARERRDWAEADALRRTIAERGWSIEDTAGGPRLRPAR